MTSLTDLLLKQKSQTLTIHFIFDLYLQQQVTLYLLIASGFVYNMMMNSPYWGAVWANPPPPHFDYSGQTKGWEEPSGRRWEELVQLLKVQGAAQKRGGGERKTVSATGTKKWNCVCARDAC